MASVARRVVRGGTHSFRGTSCTSPRLFAEFEFGTRVTRPSDNSSNAAMPAAIASGLPLNVPA
jgi:hypothetical protein